MFWTSRTSSTPPADFKQRIIVRRSRICRVEQQAMRETLPPAGGQLPVLALDVMNDGRAGPAEKGRDDQPDTFARTGRGEHHDVLRPVMTQILRAEAAEEDAARGEQPGAAHIARRGPSRGAVGRDVALLARSPQRARDGGATPYKTARTGDCARRVEDMRRIGIEMEPPAEQRPRLIDGTAQSDEPRQSELRLIGERRCRPLRREPDARHHDGEHNDDLTEKQFGGSHAGLSPARESDRAGLACSFHHGHWSEQTPSSDTGSRSGAA